MFPVFNISDASPQRSEALGTKEKRWVDPGISCGLPQVPHLFKIGRQNTGENWSEKIACEVATTLGLPCAKYEFAVNDEARGVVSETFIPPEGRFIPANMFLARAVRSQSAPAHRLRGTKYDLPGVWRVLSNLPMSAPIGSAEDVNRLGPHGVFVGYLLFDALIGNTDRHEENWGVVVVPTEVGVAQSLYLAPTFDHASSLGRNESDEKRLARLGKAEGPGSVEAYAARARSAFQDADDLNRRLSLRTVIEMVPGLSASAARFWRERIVELPREFFEGALERVSDDWISPPAREFAVRLLLNNQAAIKETIVV